MLCNFLRDLQRYRANRTGADRRKDGRATYRHNVAYIFPSFVGSTKLTTLAALVGIRVGQFIGPLHNVYRTVKQQQNLSGWIYAKGLTKDRLPAETQPSRGVYIWDSN